MSVCEQLNTKGVIAAKLSVPYHKVDYVIKAKGIEPVGRAGVARVFSDEQVTLIASEIERIEQRRKEAQV